MNEKLFDRLGIKYMHEKGWKGQGVRVLIQETKPGSDHARMTESVIRQIAPRATIGVIGTKGNYSPENVAWEAAQYKKYDIVNRSYSGDSLNTPEAYAIKKEIKDGGTMIFSAAGNSDNMLAADIDDPSVYGVDDLILLDSGEFVRAAGWAPDPNGYRDFLAPSNIETAPGEWYAGSSAATPVISGMAALIMSAYKAEGIPYTVDQIYLDLKQQCNKTVYSGNGVRQVAIDKTVTWGTWGLGEPIADHSQLGNGVPILTDFAPVKNYDEIVLQLGSNIAVVNGIPQTLEVVPFTKNNRTFVPLRFIAEALGCDIEWVGKTKSIIIRKEKNQ